MHAVHAIPIGVASAHGLVDLYAPRAHLLAYAVCAVPLRGDGAFRIEMGCFAVASVYHFACDVGVRDSALLHVLLAVLHASGFTRAALTAFVPFYSAHALRVARRCEARPTFETLATSIPVAGFITRRLLRGGGLTASATRPIIAHVIIDALRRRRTPRAQAGPAGRCGLWSLVSGPGPGLCVLTRFRR